MKKQRNYKTIINILICLMLMVCAIYHEPSDLRYSSLSSKFSKVQDYSFTALAEESKIDAEKNEQISSKSLRESSRRIIGRCSLEGEGNFLSSFFAAIIVFLTTAEILKFSFGALILFKRILSYIQSQVGL